MVSNRHLVIINVNAYLVAKIYVGGRLKKIRDTPSTGLGERIRTAQVLTKF